MEITVKHPFIFDNRHVPDSFDGISVKNVMIGSYPIEFPDENESLPLDKWYEPEHYIEFVENNLPLIRKKLKSPDLSTEEALDAIVEGGFEEHKKWCEEMKDKRINATL